MLAINPWQFFRKSITGKTGFLVAVCGATCIGVALPIYFIPHYAAPITAAIYALVLQAMRYLRLWRWRGKARRAGRWCGRSRPSASCCSCCARPHPSCTFPPPSIGSILGSPSIFRTWTAPGPWRNWRRYREANLSSCATINIIIRIMNGCIIGRISTAAKIVWARDMGDSGNAELIRYFPQRRVWLAEPDLAPPRLSPYRVRF